MTAKAQSMSQQKQPPDRRAAEPHRKQTPGRAEKNRKSDVPVSANSHTGVEWITSGRTDGEDSALHVAAQPGAKDRMRQEHRETVLNSLQMLDRAGIAALKTQNRPGMGCAKSGSTTMPTIPAAAVTAATIGRSATPIGQATPRMTGTARKPARDPVNQMPASATAITQSLHGRALRSTIAAANTSKHEGKGVWILRQAGNPMPDEASGQVDPIRAAAVKPISISAIAAPLAANVFSRNSRPRCCARPMMSAPVAP